MLFEAPDLTEAEHVVLQRIEQIHQSLRWQLSEQRRWVGLLRRVSLGRAIRGSNSIEGYDVSLDDAVAAVAGEEPLDPRSEAWMAVTAYRNAMTYVLQLADDPHFAYDESLIRALHYMMLDYDMSKSPGRWRPGPIYVEDERTGETVYTGPEAHVLPELMGEFVGSLRAGSSQAPVIAAAMAHLNLVMIHPFRDGNGRMARCVQTLVLARSGILAAPFVSIEEYLGAGTNTDACYRVLSEVGAGSWNPDRDARPWVRFVLTAHYRQAQTMVRRTEEAQRRWEVISAEVRKRAVPERAGAALFNASMGFRVRNPTYRELADVSEAVAGRDLKALVDAGLLAAVGERRGRYYLATPDLRSLDRAIRRTRRPVEDPFETLGATGPLGL
jgi:Fic family protein